MNGDSSRSGFALVSVLLIVALLALATVAAVDQARRTVGGAAAVERSARARALADGGVLRAVAELLAADAGAPEGDEPWAGDGSVLVVRLPGGEAEVSVRDEGGLIDLNAASEEVLAAMFRALEVDAAAANTLADAIADWRDEDSFARLNGAEAEAYLRAGLWYAPRDGLFETVEELGLVLGMTPAVLERALPLLTVWGHQPEIDLDIAPRRVLLAVPGMDTGKVSAILALRSGRPRVSGARTFGIRAVGRAEGGGVFVREAVVRLTRDPSRPIRVFAWKQGVSP